MANNKHNPGSQSEPGKESKRGKGRPPISETEPASQLKTMLTPTQRHTFWLLGGHDWLRAELDAAAKDLGTTGEAAL